MPQQLATPQPDLVEQIPDPETVRGCLAEAIRRAQLLRSLLRVAVRKATFDQRTPEMSEGETCHVCAFTGPRWRTYRPRMDRWPRSCRPRRGAIKQPLAPRWHRFLSTSPAWPRCSPGACRACTAMTRPAGSLRRCGSAAASDGAMRKSWSGLSWAALRGASLRDCTAAAANADGPDCEGPARSKTSRALSARKEGLKMARKDSVSPPPATHNDDGESERPADTDFNPADFEQPTTPDPAPGPDPFDPESLRLSQDFNASMGVRKALLSVPVRKPDKSWFVRVHPDPVYRLQTAVIELKEDRETYLVARHLWSDLATEATFKPKLLATAINRQNVVFIWEVNLPRADGRVDEWARTALEALNRASTGWVRMAANMALGAYDVFGAPGQLGDPTWPETPFPELLKVAFKDRFINDLNHLVLRRLRGEV